MFQFMAVTSTHLQLIRQQWQCWYCACRSCC